MRTLPNAGFQRKWLRRALVWAAAAWLLFPVGAPAQDREPGRASLPLAAWIAAGDREQIPWRVAISSPGLSNHQRLRATVFVDLDGGKLQKGSVERDLYLVVKLGDAAGGWYLGEGFRPAHIQEKLARGTHLQFSVPMFVRPGQYRVAVILYDRVTGERSVVLRQLTVKRLAGDPLLAADSDLPMVEFIPQAESPERFFLPENRAVRLGVASKRPLRIEVLANFTVSEQYTGSRVIQAFNFSLLLPVVKLFAEVQLENGSMTITALDLDRQQIFFQEENTRRLDWPRLKKGLATLDPQVTDVRSLEARKRQAAFFREVLARRIHAPARAGAPSGDGEGTGPAARRGSEPFRVFIIVGSGVLFPLGSDRKPLPPVEDCDCRVYYLRYVLLRNLWDELEGVMKPLKPRRFIIESPLDLRKALAEILKDLRAR